jgi:hypothetical protein
VLSTHFGWKPEVAVVLSVVGHIQLHGNKLFESVGRGMEVAVILYPCICQLESVQFRTPNRPGE